MKDRWSYSCFWIVMQLSTGYDHGIDGNCFSYLRRKGVFCRTKFSLLSYLNTFVPYIWRDAVCPRCYEILAIKIWIVHRSTENSTIQSIAKWKILPWLKYRLIMRIFLNDCSKKFLNNQYWRISHAKIPIGWYSAVSRSFTGQYTVRR